MLSGADPVLPSVVTSGYKLTNYLLNPDENTVNISTFTVPLVSSEGVHALHYFSVDNALNYEFPRGATIYADGTPPVSTCAVIGEGSADNGNLVLVEGSSVAISAIDPETQGFASGLGMIVFDISTSPCTGFSDYPSAPGQRRKLLYTGAFSLGVGTHTLYYAAMDNVGNMERIKSVHVDVAGSPRY